MHPAKRRRTDNARSALTKPFRSPLHVDPNKQRPSPEKHDDLTSQAPTEHSTPTKLTSNVLTASSSPPSEVFTSPKGKGRQKPTTSLTSHRRASTPRTTTHDQTYIALQKQHSALNLQLKDLSASLDTITQAVKISQSGNDENLERLVIKWRTASREAAEELFSTAKDRVNRMGGVGVWREKYTKPQEQEPWNDEPNYDEDELTEEQKEQLEIARDEARAEAEKYGLQHKAPVVDVNDDDSFTIDMMLKQLNVDLDVIGYDLQSQRWAD